MSNKEFESIAFDLPKNQSNVIKVIGVGGGGSNAINHMFLQGIKGVDFVICNTDAQALQNSGVPNKIQLGVNLTEGLGAGANPEVGEQSAVESLEEIQRMFGSNTKMVFITAGMGGGTGTGAAPVIAKMAKDLDILTVGIVTMPFQFEGKMRNEQAQKGIENLRAQVDSLIVINNNKLREVYGNLGFKAGFSKADEVLATASRGIAEVITHHYTQNIDLRDAKTVLSNSGTAIMGSATASGQNRAQDAIRKALDSPLLNDNKITGAKNVLLLIVSGNQEITIDEIGEINDHIQAEAGHGANIIMGVGEDDSLDESIAVTIIATGFNVEQQDEISNTETKRVVHSLEEEPKKAIKPIELTTPSPIAAVRKKPEPAPVVKHTLDLDENVDPLAQFEKGNASKQIKEKKEVQKRPLTMADLGIIPTTDVIKNLNVVSKEVSSVNEAEEDFVITPSQEHTEDENEEPVYNKQQITLSFDMPLTEESIEDTAQHAPQASYGQPEAKTNPAPTPESRTQPVTPIVYDLESEIKDFEVKDPVEIIQVSTSTSAGEKRYALDDYDLADSSMNASKKKQPEVEKDFDAEIEFKKKVVKEIVPEEVADDLDPMNSSISDILKERADERRLKMKNFNHKFNTSKIDEIEKTPAYKRQGLDLKDAQHSSESNVSRTSLGVDDNDDIQLRSNNSFLHDNVD
ncbi:cell division protein FtsZ [Bizionia saleffrena]|uniref:Cell division protein FtsZ n=1 Tax=Bizionia saleffrena TaxID=291189 RepID=A0A8H2LFA7_9FLAO|nr:cell division protein FtsZ [Bizionia saleffrena]TYB78074.1 cell division protein FtsZ [Bizionia saleffrena]